MRASTSIAFVICDLIIQNGILNTNLRTVFTLNIANFWFSTPTMVIHLRFARHINLKLALKCHQEERDFPTLISIYSNTQAHKET
jgi:hypothetical protein